MREFKFRAWVTYKTDHRWDWAYKEAEKLHLDYEETAEKRDFFLEEWDKEHSQEERFTYKEYMANLDEISISLRGRLAQLLNLEVLDIMQFSGLKDKNGVEIYEGDIVRVQSQYETDEPVDFSLNKVYFRDGAFRCGFHDMILGDKVCRNMEVVGNIYENPELLRKEQVHGIQN